MNAPQFARRGVTVAVFAVCAAILSAGNLARAGEPSLAVQVTVPMGDCDVTLYRDADESSHTLYYMPSRLALTKGRDGQPMFNVAVVRELENVVQQGETFDDTRAGKRAGGVVDAYMELRGVRDLAALRQRLGETYPQYQDYEIAQVPLAIGSASIAVSALGFADNDPASPLAARDQKAVRTASSGGPVSEQFGGVIPLRFLLSQYDTVILIDSLRQHKSFTSAFDVTLTATANMWMPPSKIHITCDKRQVYQYSESHFKAKGGIAFWSFSADIRNIRQQLEQSGSLKVEIEDAGNAHYSAEVLQGIADKWVENFVLKEMFTTAPPLATGSAQAADPGKRHGGWFGWASLGTSYAKVNIQDIREGSQRYDFEYKARVAYPVYAKCILGDLTADNLTYIDLNHSCFTYLPMGVVPFDREVLQSPDFRSAAVSFVAVGEDGGAGQTRVADFSKVRPGVYQTRMPLMLKSDAGQTVVSQMKDVTYSVHLDFANQPSIDLANLRFVHSDWEFDTPTIYLTSAVDYKPVRVLPQVWTKYRNLEQVSVQVHLANDAAPPIRFEFDAGRATPRYVFYPKGAAGLPIRSYEVTAAYDVTGHPELTRSIPYTADGGELCIRSGQIPGIDEHGGAH